MAVREHPPLVLVPSEQTPPDEVLMSGISQDPANPGEPFSNIFPTLQGFEGNTLYCRGAPPPDSPFNHILEGIMAYRYDFYRQENDNDGIRTEQTGQGLAITLLQSHLAQCLSKGYENFLKRGLTHGRALSKVGGFVLAREAIATDEYSQRLDWSVHHLAELDRHDNRPKPTEIEGIPVIDFRELLLALGKVPPSEEVELEEERDFFTAQIKMLKGRLRRVKFERLSAIAILELVQ